MIRERHLVTSAPVDPAGFTFCRPSPKLIPGGLYWYVVQVDGAQWEALQAAASAPGSTIVHLFPPGRTPASLLTASQTDFFTGLGITIAAGWLLTNALRALRTAIGIPAELFDLSDRD